MRVLEGSGGPGRTSYLYINQHVSKRVGSYFFQYIPMFIGILPIGVAMKKPVLLTFEGLLFAVAIATIFVVVEIFEGVLQ